MASWSLEDILEELRSKREKHPSEIRTSRTHPLSIAWIRHRSGGALGLTFAPGKQAWAKMGSHFWRRSIAADLKVLEHERTDRVVCLLEDHELDAMRITHLPRMAEKRGIAFSRFPIVDARVPESIPDAKKLVRGIAKEIRSSGRVVVHCAGGLGRTGTIAGCVLQDLGWHPIDALEELEYVRGPRCPETMAQVNFVASWCDSM